MTDVSTVCALDVMAAYGSGVIEPHEATDMHVRLIAHCENMGERICILDSPPSSSPQGVLEVAAERRRVRFEVRCGVLPVA